jgi:FHS family Na+ dependent glucose MFS transporter 1
MEVTFGSLVMTYSVTFLGWSKARGSLLTSVFWGSFAAARGLAIFLAKCLTPPVMIIIDLVIVIFALIGLVMGAESSDVVMWVCTALLGIGMASIFPTGITWAERYMHVTGKATAVFVGGSALGEMLMPALSGFLFEAKGPMWLLYILLGASIFSIVIYIIMQNLATNMGERYDRLRNIPEALRYSADSRYLDDDLEMNSLTPTNSTYSDDWSIQRRKRVTFNLNGAHGTGHHSNGDVTIHSASNGEVGPKQSILKAKANGKIG